MDSEKIDFFTKIGVIENVFEYHYLDDEKRYIYEYFEEKFQTLVQMNSKSFELKNCFFYIKNSFSCNAFAYKTQGYNFIGITNGYPILMHDKFRKKHFLYLIAIALDCDKPISDAYCDLYEDVNFEFHKFMLDCS
ncbi:MAG: hypothetical protein AB8B69_00355, partial [Chitinophagales bacterium]